MEHVPLLQDPPLEELLGASVNKESQPSPRRMSGITTFFHHCPSCGRRFEVKLVSKGPAGFDSFVEEEGRVSVSPRGYQRTGKSGLARVDTQYLVDAEDFQYEYRCKHCGHEWSEVHGTERKVNEPKGYTGD